MTYLENNKQMSSYDRENIGRNLNNISESNIIEEKIIKLTGDIQIKRYLKGRLLGKGGFAKCYEITNLENKHISAAKIVCKSSLVKARSKQKLISEIRIHKSLQHTNVVHFDHYFEDPENVYILLEMCHNQSMNELIKRRKRLTELEVQCYVVQLINALKYLRSNKIIHRDLKLGNLFISEKMELKVGDFGLAARLEFDGERKRTVCGTPNYIAPEILDGKTGHSYEVDIWSLGVIIYTLLIGKPPFETQDVKNTYRKIRANEYSFPNSIMISDFAKQLIIDILQTDPEQRPTLDQLLTYDFFHQGLSIPKLLPSSTLACTPSMLYIKNFIPNIGPNGIIQSNTIHQKILNDQQNLTTTASSHYCNTDNNDPNSQIDESKEQLTTINSKLLALNIKEELNLPSVDVWVKKWVDYSSKYGLGYLLNDGCVGVYFNDSSKIILDPIDQKFIYIERRLEDKQEVLNSYLISDYPKELHKKVTLMHHFKNYMLSNNNKENINIEEIKNKQNDYSHGVKDKITNKDKNKAVVYVKKWMRTRHSILFRLSNKIVQVCFQDHTEIILSSETRVVTYINKKGERILYPLSTALESNNNEMTKRLKYTKEILTHMLSMSNAAKEEKIHAQMDRDPQGVFQYQPGYNDDKVV